MVAGESLVDIVRPLDGAEVYAAGGSPMNVAVGLARLGVDTTLVTEIGDDDLGRVIIEHVTASGVELAPDAVVPGRRTSTATARLDRQMSARYDFDLRWDPAPYQLPGSVTGLHVGSLDALLEPGRALVADLVAETVRRNRFVSYDPNVRAGLVGDPEAAWRDVRALARQAGLVKLSDEDCRVLRPDRPERECLAELLDDAPLVVVTRGASGASAYAGARAVSVPGRSGTVVDTVGAGDSFMAALIAVVSEHRWTTSRSWTHDELGFVLEAATTAAAVTCSRRGADPPTRRELGPGWPGLIGVEGRHENAD
ncbi:MAG: PfkB family carbohydrate kinase [Nocardioidaceae bacterium]